MLLYAWPHLIFTRTLEKGYWYYLHFTDEKTEAWRVIWWSKSGVSWDQTPLVQPQLQAKRAKHSLYLLPTAAHTCPHQQNQGHANRIWAQLCFCWLCGPIRALNKHLLSKMGKREDDWTKQFQSWNLLVFFCCEPHHLRLHFISIIFFNLQSLQQETQSLTAETSSVSASGII